MERIEAIVAYQQPWNRSARQFKLLWRNAKLTYRMLVFNVKSLVKKLKRSFAPEPEEEERRDLPEEEKKPEQVEMTESKQ